MTICKNCGTEVTGSDRFCGNCGTAIEAPADSQASPAPTDAGPPKTAAADGGLEYKGVGIRFAAHFVDVVLVLIFYFVVGSIIADMTGGATDEGFELQGGAALLLMVVTFVASMAYFIILEAKWNGQTLGKKMVGIRVASEDGGSASVQQTTVRNLLRIVDALPCIYIVGIILIWTSDRKQRLGDRIAGTVVTRAAGRGGGEESRPRKRSRIKFSMGKGSGYLDT